MSFRNHQGELCYTPQWLGLIESKKKLGLSNSLLVHASRRFLRAQAGFLQMYENAELVRLWVALANIFVFFICLLVLIKNISKKLDELERSKKDD